MEEKIIIEFRPGMTNAVNGFFFEKKPTFKDGKKYDAHIQFKGGKFTFPISEKNIQRSNNGYIIDSLCCPGAEGFFSKMKFGEFGIMTVKEIE